MNNGLSIFQIVLLALYAFGMAGGQLLFKTAALQSPGSAPLAARLFALIVNPAFLAAITLYGVLSVLWVWVLTFTPLSRAYPFVAIAFALTPVLGAIAFAEPLSARLIIGIVIVVAGLFLIAG